MKAAVDIGTNSMRLLLVADDGREIGRWARVTGLGKGLDATGRLAEEAIQRTIAVLGDYGQLVVEHGATRARAVATSASRDAANRDEFFDRAESALGFRPEVIPGEEEARLSYLGATSGLEAGARLWFIESGGPIRYSDARFDPADYLVFGRETLGLPPAWLDQRQDRWLRVPMVNPAARSLNLANCVAIVLFEALRQTGFNGEHR